jgi:glycosyltransferase involved in cell wall biosynthesis
MAVGNALAAGSAPRQFGPLMPPPEPRLHPAHQIWRLLPAAPRRRLLAHGTALLAPRPDRAPPAVAPGAIVAGEVSRASGLGEGARLFHAALGLLGAPAWCIDIGSLVPGEAADLLPPAPPAALPAGVPLLAFVNGPMLPLAALRLGRGVMRGRRVIGHWVWELASAPESWAAGLGFVHEIWVPSAFTAAALAPLAARRGVPIRIVPYPVAARPPAPAALDRTAFGLPDGALVTLVSASLASSIARKNPEAAIRAHRAAFGERPDRVLVLKLGHSAHYRDDLAALAAAAEGAGNIRFETRTLPTADSLALTACSDIVLSLHRSEGFGLVPAEAMLLGKPVVATAWSGNMDFMDADSAALVGYRLIPVADPRGTYDIPGAAWAEPDIAEAAVHLTRLADSAEARAALGARAKAAAGAKLGVQPLADALAALAG